ncbi:MAG: DUF1326 domain-containing protein [Rhodospirillales bacterium]|jgi:hypothetical protein|nr:DUF1326 domain-containing protein [Rhodospirillales bacterium]MBT4040771.1 DUF1326 domain-containing protein [Rhodospirillales bacterium]MBT4628020.1 DUF1326 domain-containing protein [Rhodospirillales bacterium]MBT5351700.1 DUF1326 domain-containing protein [Rhodospirillales bacterium]MBT5520880.1 DUF1326 domain-containing protein [Rhodospirillales bacterium]
MAHVDWELHGLEFGNCNCDYSCPCQFEAKPTHGDCRGIGFFKIDKGHFGDVSLDGLKMGAVYDWPATIPEGNGKCQIFIDENADEAQRDALYRLSMGEEAEPFSNIFTVYTATCTTFHDTVYTDILFEMDMDKRTGHGVAKGLCETIAEPIIGFGGDEHRAQIHLPKGIECRVMEAGKGSCTVEGPMAMKLDDGFAQFNEVHLNQNGVMG